MAIAQETISCWLWSPRPSILPGNEVSARVVYPELQNSGLYHWPDRIQFPCQGPDKANQITDYICVALESPSHEYSSVTYYIEDKWL